MKHFLIAGLALAVMTAAIAFSRNAGLGGLGLKEEPRNPWTHLKVNNDPGEFQFAIVSDRTGGHRARIFSRAVERLNLLQPEFVVSVGDLIEGGKKADRSINGEWEEFDGYVKRLKMPFFYVSGNHDVGNVEIDRIWQERYGRRWYHFVYRDVLFLCLNTDDPPGSGVGNLGNEQVAYAKQALAQNKDVRWTMVFVHKPVWTASDVAKRGWLDVEKALASRPYTVFCGHVHRYQKFVRQGRNYYQLATTGGGSKLRGVDYGEFDHIVWVTMKKDGPVLANILLDSILPDDLAVPESKEVGVKVTRHKTHPVQGWVYLEGVPLVGAQVVLTPVEENSKTAARADALSQGDGSFLPSTYAAHDGMAAGKYTVTVVQRRPLWTAEGKAGPNQLPAKYANVKTSGLTVEVPEGGGEIKLELRR